MAQRLLRISAHVQGNADLVCATPTTIGNSPLKARPCIGEMENRQVDQEAEGRRQQTKTKKGKFVRHTIKIVFPDSSAADERYGGSGDFAIIEGELILPNTESKTVIIFMHPSGIQNLLPMPVAMARAGLHVITCGSRYPNNDTALIMEKVVVDLGACIRHAKQQLGYEKVLLAGWSGGGSLSSFYQSQAQLGAKALMRTPAGDKVDLPSADLIPADALLILAAHISRAKIFTEWLDPAVLDEKDPSRRDVELDLWDPRNPHKAPFSPSYVAKFRAAQIARNQRITSWAREQLQALEARAETERGLEEGTLDWRRSQRDLCFVTPCTQADLRRVDVKLDPNGREATSLAALAQENHSPVGLARFSTCRSWLSQWSYDESNADGPSSLKNVTVPVLVLANEADHLVPLTHPKEMFDAIPHSNKELHIVKGATHYYFGQQDLMAGAIEHISKWAQGQGLLEEGIGVR